MQIAEMISPLALAELSVSLPQKPEAAVCLGAWTAACGKQFEVGGLPIDFVEGQSFVKPK